MGRVNIIVELLQVFCSGVSSLILGGILPELRRGFMIFRHGSRNDEM
jgi:hypothetical protein